MSELLEFPQERFDYETHVGAHLSSVRSAVLEALRSAGEDVVAQKEVLRLLEAHKVAYLNLLVRTYGERCLEPRSDDGMGNLVARVLESIPGNHPRRDEFLAQMAEKGSLKARLGKKVAEQAKGLDHEIVLDVQEHLDRVRDAVLNVIQYSRRAQKDQVLHSAGLFARRVIESFDAAT